MSMNEYSLPRFPATALEDVANYLNTLPSGSWYWTLSPWLFTFEEGFEDEELIFRLKFPL